MKHFDFPPQFSSILKNNNEHVICYFVNRNDLNCLNLLVFKINGYSRELLLPPKSVFIPRTNSAKPTTENNENLRRKKVNRDIMERKCLPTEDLELSGDQ